MPVQFVRDVGRRRVARPPMPMVEAASCTSGLSTVLLVAWPKTRTVDRAVAVVPRSIREGRGRRFRVVCSAEEARRFSC